MKWNWQQKDWPLFKYNNELIKDLEHSMLLGSGMLFGSFCHLSEEDKEFLKVEIISNEAIKTSEIEGEYLNRDSVQSSILRQFNLRNDNRKVSPAEKAISELMVDLYNNYHLPISHESLHKWHKILMGGRIDLNDIGRYRTANDPMQVVSGPIHQPKIHFEAPPAENLFEEMETFISWFNDESISKAENCLVRASIAHLYFVSIHPYEDGNGRIARALVEKLLARSLGQPTLIAIATIIEKNKKAYYYELEQANKSNEVTRWINYFAQVILDAQKYTQEKIEFLIKKSKFYQAFKEVLNERQKKVIARIFQEGSEGFKGGLSAENYLAITKTSRATATRDLQDLVQKKAMLKSGDKKYARYSLNLFEFYRLI